jgi:hypothetical protein
VGEEMCVRYCGELCQKRDWRYHKLLCKKFKPFLEANPRPSIAHKLVLLLPQDEEEPKLIWMRFRKHYVVEPPYESFDSSEAERLMGPGRSGMCLKEYIHASTVLEQEKPGPRNDLDHSVEVIAHDDSGEYYINICITTTLRGKLGHSWSGPFLAFSQIGKRSMFAPDLDYQDFLLSDLRVLFEFFRDVKYS